MKVSCWFKISLQSKWPIWNPYRFEFNCASTADWTPKWDFQPKWSLIPGWVHFASNANVLLIWYLSKTRFILNSCTLSSGSVPVFFRWYVYAILSVFYYLLLLFKNTLKTILPFFRISLSLACWSWILTSLNNELIRIWLRTFHKAVLLFKRLLSMRI